MIFLCCGHKMFLNKIRNIFCVPDTKFVSATNVARAGKRVETVVSATMCPPWQTRTHCCRHKCFPVCPSAQHLLRIQIFPQQMFPSLRSPRNIMRKLGNICCGHKMFLNKIRNIFWVPDTKFVFATNVARAGKRRNICVGNNVSASPRLPGPLIRMPRRLVSLSFFGTSYSAFFSPPIGLKT